jgi:hypothetical protein
MLSIFSKQAFRELKAAPPDQIFNIFVLGIIPSAIAYVCWTKAIALAPKTSQATIYMFFVPLCTAIAGILIAGKNLDLSTIFGGTVILSGMLLFNRRGFFKKLIFDSRLMQRRAFDSLWLQFETGKEILVDVLFLREAQNQHINKIPLFSHNAFPHFK